MLQREKVKFRITERQPNPKEVDYWVDLNSNQFGGCIRYYNEGSQSWQQLDLNSAQISDLLAYIAEQTLDLNNTTKEELEGQIEALNNEITQLKERLNTVEETLRFYQAKVDN